MSATRMTSYFLKTTMKRNLCLQDKSLRSEIYDLRVKQCVLKFNTSSESRDDEMNDELGTSLVLRVTLRIFACNVTLFL